MNGEQDAIILLSTCLFICVALWLVVGCADLHRYTPAATRGTITVGGETYKLVIEADHAKRTREPLSQIRHYNSIPWYRDVARAEGRPWPTIEKAFYKWPLGYCLDFTDGSTVTLDIPEWWRCDAKRNMVDMLRQFHLDASGADDLLRDIDRERKWSRKSCGNRRILL
jgi:hypothetical protein